MTCGEGAKEDEAASTPQSTPQQIFIQCFASVSSPSSQRSNSCCSGRGHPRHFRMKRYRRSRRPWWSYAATTAAASLAALALAAAAANCSYLTPLEGKGRGLLRGRTVTPCHISDYLLKMHGLIELEREGDWRGCRDEREVSQQTRKWKRMKKKGLLLGLSDHHLELISLLLLLLLLLPLRLYCLPPSFHLLFLPQCISKSD